MKKLFATAGLLLLATTANAATLVYSSPGVVTGIAALDVGGAFYDVDFGVDQIPQFQTFGGDEVFWTTVGDAQVAAAAVATALSGESSVNNDHSASFTINYEGSSFGARNVLYEFAVTTWEETFSDVNNLTMLNFYNGTTAHTAWSVAAVPVPAAVWLFGSALAGLGWLRRKPTA